jgi:hypothetical protein
MPIKLANNATSTIATAINASDVGVVLATGDGAKFPTLAAGEYFYITFESSGGTYEIAKATARAGDSLTIVRAQEGTTAQSFAAGSRVELRVTAASINDLVDEHDQASEISFVPYGWIAATNVQDALEEVSDDISASSGSSLVGYLPAGTGAVTTTVQAKLRENVSAQDFGAVGDGVTDDTVAIQKFFDYIQANNVGTAYCDGNFAISSGITVGRTANCLTKHIVGDATFTALNAIDTMLSFKECGFLNWNGSVRVLGTGSTTYVSRTCRIGIRIAGQGLVANRLRFDKLEADNFNQVGIYVENLSTLSDLGNTRVSDCGSGLSLSGYSLLANWSGRVDTGSSGSTGQRTTITVDQLPPSQYTGTRNPNCYIVINGELYYIYAVNTGASTISVFPWIDLNVTSGSLRYVFGAGIYTNGGDSGIIGIKQIDAVRCSVGLNTTALYGPIVDRFVAQFCGIAFAFGGSPEAASVTFQLNGLYTEGNDYDILRVTRATVGGIIASSYALNFEKIAYVNDARSSGNVFNNVYNNMRSIAIYQNGILNRFLQDRKNRDSTGSTLTIGATNLPLHNQYKRDSWTINLARPSLSNNDAFGYNADTVTIFGTGPNYAPTGTFTFVAPTSTTVTTTGSGTISRVELTVADDTGILRGQDVTGTGIAAGTTVVRVSGDVVILSLPLTATISSSSVTFSNTVATTVNGGATAAFNGFNSAAIFSVYYDFAADNFIVSTSSVGSFPSTTAANIANKANIFNTQNKYLGRGVWDTTNNRLMIATGSTDVSPWYIADGSASVIPA